MKVQGRERIAFNFIGLLKSFISNDSTTIEDKATERAVKEMMGQQDNRYIKGLETATVSQERIRSNKKGQEINKIDVSKENQVERSYGGNPIEKERD